MVGLSSLNVTRLLARLAVVSVNTVFRCIEHHEHSLKRLEDDFEVSSEGCRSSRSASVLEEGKQMAANHRDYFLMQTEREF